MSVYVDRCQAAHVAGAPRAKSWCHMIADTPDELHAMASSIGLRREWFQAAPPASFPHYDLTATRRKEAVKLGAVECDRSTFVAYMRRIREESRRAT